MLFASTKKNEKFSKSKFRIEIGRMKDCEFRSTTFRTTRNYRDVVPYVRNGRTEPFCLNLRLLRLTTMIGVQTKVNLKSVRLIQNGSVRPV